MRRKDTNKTGCIRIRTSYKFAAYYDGIHLALIWAKRLTDDFQLLQHFEWRCFRKTCDTKGAKLTVKFPIFSIMLNLIQLQKRNSIPGEYRCEKGYITWNDIEENLHCTAYILQKLLQEENISQRMKTVLSVNWNILNVHWMLTECLLKSGFQALFSDISMYIQSHWMVLNCRHISVIIQYFVLFSETKFKRNISDLPCGGCKYCQKIHNQWSRFGEDIDDVVSLAVREAWTEL